MSQVNIVCSKLLLLFLSLFPRVSYGTSYWIHWIVWTILLQLTSVTALGPLDHFQNYLYEGIEESDPKISNSSVEDANQLPVLVLNGSTIMTHVGAPLVNNSAVTVTTNPDEYQYPLRNRNLRMAPYQHSPSSPPKSILTVIIIVILVIIIWMCLVSVICALTGLFSSKKTRSKTVLPSRDKLDDHKLVLSPKHQYRRQRHLSHSSNKSSSIDHYRTLPQNNLIPMATSDKLSQPQKDIVLLVARPPTPPQQQLQPPARPPSPQPNQSSSSNFTDFFGLTSFINNLLSFGNGTSNNNGMDGLRLGPNNNNNNSNNGLQKLKIYNGNTSSLNQPDNNCLQSTFNNGKSKHFNNNYNNNNNNNNRYNNNNQNRRNFNNSKQIVYKHRHNPHCRINNQFNLDDDFSEYCLDLDNLSYKSVQSNFTTISQVMFKKDPKTNAVRLCNV